MNTATNSFSHLNHAWRAAISLNNTGVFLLTRREHSGALETFQNSLHIMRSCVAEQERDTKRAIDGYIQQSLARATSKMAANPQKLRGGPSLEVITNHCSPAAGIITKRRQDTLFLIILEGFSQLSDERLESSMILHNYATAYFCLGLDTADREQKIEMLLNAYKILQLAHSLSETGSSSEASPAFLLINLLLVNNLMRVSKLLKLETYFHYSCSFDNLIEAISIERDFLQLTDSEHSNAPAA